MSYTRSKWPRMLACWAVCLATAAQVVEAKTREECEQQYEPDVNQAGKDVVWVPTDDALVLRMLEMAQTGPADKVYDLGAGDGKIAIAAAKQFGARAVGVEYNPDMVALAQCLVVAEGVADQVRIVQGDIFETDFSSATVVTLYLLPDLNLRLRPTLLEMAPGTRVVSHAFLMADWKPDAQVTESANAYLWIVPAPVDGKWTFRENGGKETFTLDLDQKFQKITGTIRADQALASAELSGAKLTATFEDQGVLAKLTGEYKDERIEAVVTRGGKSKKFTGTRS